MQPYKLPPAEFVSTSSSFFFFNDTATTEIYTLSLHDALPISGVSGGVHGLEHGYCLMLGGTPKSIEIFAPLDRKSTRLNSSHGYISYAVFCLKKKKSEIPTTLSCRHILLACRSVALSLCKTS